MGIADELERLQALRDRGTLTHEEFERAKNLLLAETSAHSAHWPRRNSLPHWWSMIHRSRHDRWLGGVCGGLGELNIAPSWFWRLLFCASVPFALFGVFVYILMWIFVPQEPDSGKIPVGHAATSFHRSVWS